MKRFILISVAALVMAGVIALVRLGLIHVGVSAALRLAAVVPVGIALYAGLLVVGAPNENGDH